MKLTTHPLTFFQRTVTGVLAMLIACGLSIRSALAYEVTLTQTATGVEAVGSGPIDLTGLSSAVGSIQGGALVNPMFGIVVTGTTVPESLDFYLGFSGPSNFGSGSIAFASSGSGDRVEMHPAGGGIGVPSGYVSNSPLSDSSTYSGQTFAGMGITPGTYVWTWGAGANQNFTLHVVAPAGVPDSGSTLGLLFLSLLGLVGVSRFRSLRSA
jgi:protein with PEP-CTERM/exosortase system signal